jgi:23S rRNA pseudouridine2604 synthase
MANGFLNKMNYPMRINKHIALVGWASRREADTLISEGKIFVNGKKAVIGQQVNATDIVTLAGETKDKQYLAYYKGRGIISHSPNSHEVDIISKIKTDYGLEDIYPVGRLDKDSEGLIILTNDGRVTAPLLSPTSGIKKIYEVEVDKNINSKFLREIEKGVNIEGYITKPAKAEQKSPKRFLLTLKEGKKHQIRRMCAALGYQIQSLKRVQIANIELGTIKPNQYRKISGEELDNFLQNLQLKK